MRQIWGGIGLSQNACLAGKIDKGLLCNRLLRLIDSVGLLRVVVLVCLSLESFINSVPELYIRK